jgi:hypothetical protein
MCAFVGDDAVKKTVQNTKPYWMQIIFCWFFAHYINIPQIINK